MKMTLKALRANKNLTLEEAAKKLGVSETTLRSWESGKTYPRVNELYKIEQAYDVKYDNINFFID